MRNVVAKACMVVALMLFVFGLTQKAEAIPTFARKYRTSCNTCHVAIPKLTAFGESYRLNGYQIPEGEAAYIKEEPVSLGASAWRKVWPGAVWPGAIPGTLPLSVRTILDTTAGKNASNNLDFPHEIEMFMSGLLGENIPFYTEIEFEGGATSTEAWLGFYNLLGNVFPERAVNLKVGNLFMNSLPMANDHLRIGVNHYLYGNWKLSDASSSASSFRLRDTRPGVELNGILKSRFWYSAGLLQGIEAGDKDVYAVLRYKFGGTAFDRSAPGDLGESIGGKASGFWVDDAFELSAFGYRGSTKINDEDDDFWRAGLGLRGTHQNLDLAGGFIWGRNDDPYGTSSSQSVDSQSWIVEANYVFKPWLIGALRYEGLALDTPTDFSVTDIDEIRWVPGLIFQIRPNIKLVTEGLLYEKYDAGSGPDSFTARLDFSF